MQRNKAQLQLQFNWIFVLIVGAALLLFFFTIIGGQSKSNEQGIAINLAQRMKTILSATEQQPGTIKIYDRIPPLAITFACDASQDFYNYQVEGVDAVDTKYNLIFSPRNLQGNVIYTWTEEWRIPYPVANFLYLTNNKQHYVFYNGTDYAPMTRLYENFPENFSKRAWQKDEADKKLNMEGYTYVFFLGQLTPSESLSFVNTDSDVEGNVIVINPKYSTDPYAYGDIYYLRLNQVKTVDDTEDLRLLLPSSQKTTYLGEASLYGAIFSSSKSSYECTMAKAMHRLQILTLLQYYRTQHLVQQGASANCEFLLNATSVGAAPILRSINQTVSDTFTTATMEKLFGTIGKLDNVNNQLATMTNCPAIY